MNGTALQYSAVVMPFWQAKHWAVSVLQQVSLGPDQKHRGVYSLPVSLCAAPQFLASKVRQMEKYLWKMGGGREEERKRGREEERKRGREEDREESDVYVSHSSMVGMW